MCFESWIRVPAASMGTAAGGYTAFRGQLIAMTGREGNSQDKLKRVLSYHSSLGPWPEGALGSQPGARRRTSSAPGEGRSSTAGCPTTQTQPHV